jgi:menaquinol-cytochrome c reductase iron-sulfur subunit
MITRRIMEEANAADMNTEGSRRRFLIMATGILTFLCTAALSIPLVGSFMGGVFRQSKTNWLVVAAVKDLPVGSPVNLRAVDVQVDAYLRESVIRHLWVIKHSDSQVTVFSPICPHLGCHYNWNQASGHFECPCHGSVYAPDGTVLGGPAPRRLDTLATRIEDGKLSVEWQMFQSGIRQKIPV